MEVSPGCGRNLYLGHASIHFITEGIVMERRAYISRKNL
jgi:hypothetical protein